ncbi:MAG: 5'/3'-nucleotidase SurE [Alistipes sp.]|nr:5'/3'-nucleotidase SurE [Alistipes senegalensis]MCM1249761.1 5'/3'-nucleotidase SurE [Alistipes sp.]
MEKGRLILVTNDDGYASKGLEAAIETVRGLGRVVVVAPETVQSGMSQAITMYNPLYLRRIRQEEDLEVYAFSGTPVDCVKMAFDYLLREERVDLVVSGINHGSNSAVNVLYSGTMGAAIEGSFYGCPAVGLSLDDHSADADFEAAVRYGRRIVEEVLAGEVSLPLCLNVNVPACRPEEVRGVRLCRQNRGFWREEFYRHEDPRGREYFWLTGEFVNMEPEAEDTDEWALAHGYVSVVPVQTDMTDYRQLERLRGVVGGEQGRKK